MPCYTVVSNNEKLNTEFVHIRMNDELYQNLLNLSSELEVKLPNVLRNLCDKTLDKWDSMEQQLVLLHLRKVVNPERTISLRLSLRLQKRIMKYKRRYNRSLSNIVYNLIYNGFSTDQSQRVSA